jgi:hypothetical protein
VPDFIKLPSERVEQLRMLSKRRDVPVADLIGEYVNQQIELGNLEASIPGIEVTCVGDRVSIVCAELNLVLTKEAAEVYARALKLYSEPKRAQQFPGAGPEALAVLTGISQVVRDTSLELSGVTQRLGISRRGTSIKLSGSNGSERTLAPSIARDLAQVILNAIK